LAGVKLLRHARQSRRVRRELSERHRLAVAQQPFAPARFSSPDRRATLRRAPRRRRAAAQ
jgi:hypothetical protein